MRFFGYFRESFCLWKFSIIKTRKFFSREIMDIFQNAKRESFSKLIQAYIIKVAKLSPSSQVASKIKLDLDFKKKSLWCQMGFDRHQTFHPTFLSRWKKFWISKFSFFGWFGGTIHPTSTYKKCPEFERLNVRIENGCLYSDFEIRK